MRFVEIIEQKYLDTSKNNPIPRPFIRLARLKVPLATLIVAEFPVEVYDIMGCRPERKHGKLWQNSVIPFTRKILQTHMDSINGCVRAKARFLALTGPIDFPYLTAP